MSDLLRAIAHLQSQACIGKALRMTEIDESCDDDAMVIACIQEFDEFVARKLRRYPIDAVAVAAGSYLAGLLGALFDEHQFTADEVRQLLREMESDILDPEHRT